MHANDPILPTRQDFERLARSYDLIPVYRRLTADLETPVSAFLRLAAEEPESFLLESVENGEKIGRYTFIGVRPYRKITAYGTDIHVTEKGPKKPTERRFTGDIFALLKEALNGRKPARLPNLPPFTGGAVGFFAYDAVRLIERLPASADADLSVPDACLMFYDEVLAFDHVKKEILLIVTADTSAADTSAADTSAQKPADAYRDAVRRLDRFEKRLSRPLPKQSRARISGKLKLTARTSKKDFLKAVERTKDYIAAGDIFQAVLSQRFDVEPGVDPFSIYRALRIVNPSPYMYFLRFTAPRTRKEAAKAKKRAEQLTHIVGSSPELLVRVAQGKVEYRPIAGTRPRSDDEETDRQIAAELLADEKERAEHVMLVDLGRNDVGRVSEYGSVKVTDLMYVERYSHVMHLVSSIEGQLRKGLNAVDAFRACFPAGTLSGAPKVRAMEILDELEPTRRGIYGGAVLYADFSGNLDSCIAIRTLLLEGKKGYIQAGAGIVADSVPEKEYEESLNKSRAVVRAIERART